MSDLAISNQARFAKMTRLRRFFRWLVMFSGAGTDRARAYADRASDHEGSLSFNGNIHALS
jgi:hypothetical protein